MREKNKLPNELKFGPDFPIFIKFHEYHQLGNKIIYVNLKEISSFSLSCISLMCGEKIQVVESLENIIEKIHQATLVVTHESQE